MKEGQFDMNTVGLSSSEPEQIRRFLEMVPQYREQLYQSFVVVPVRPFDGISLPLARCLSIWYGEGLSWGPFEDHMGGFIEVTRARIARDFVFNRQHTEKFLIMIDNDIDPCLDLPILLTRHDQPIVSAVCCSMGPEHGTFACFSRQDSAGEYRMPTVEKTRKLPASGLMEVGHCGTGAICIRRDVLEAFTYDPGDIPFYVPEDIRQAALKTGNLAQGEDIAFCVAARKKGFQVYVDLEAHCGHRKSCNLSWPQDLRDPSLNPETFVVAPYGPRFSLG